MVKKFLAMVLALGACISLTGAASAAIMPFNNWVMAGSVTEGDKTFTYINNFGISPVFNPDVKFSQKLH